MSRSDDRDFCFSVGHHLRRAVEALFVHQIRTWGAATYGADAQGRLKTLVTLDARLSMYVILYSVKTMSFTETRANLAAALDAVENDAEELVITRAGHEPVVVVTLAEYESLKETDYLMRSPANARRLREAIEQDRAGDGTLRELADPDAVDNGGTAGGAA
jgi:antitoxin YefM